MKRNLPNRRLGNIAILSATLLAMMMGMVAFAVDLGYIAHARTELQRTADAVVLAAATELPDTAAATSMGIATSTNNSSAISPTLTSSNFEYGWWNRNTSTFTTPTPASRKTNAVRVTINRTTATGNPLDLFYGRVLGKSSTDMTITAIAWNDRGLCGAFVGIQSLDAPGTITTDSYDSVEGLYDPLTAYDNGSICSDGNITIGGDAYIDGNATYGEGDSITVNGGDATVTGYLGERTRPLDYPSVDTSYVSVYNDNDSLPKVWRANDLGLGYHWHAALDNFGNFELRAGEVYTIPPGTYYFNNFTLQGGATLNITGETIIYVTGKIYRGGLALVNNNTGSAQNLQLYSTGGTVNVTSDNAFYGVIYAPDSDVTISGSADYFGAVVGRTLKVTGTGQAHYDESLNLEAIDPPNRTTLVD
ncbi:MAG TPA: TadE/TadG family type IV pilus assembly protein [Pirellulaceae bacterium]|nr:TadE/TadG family type IV pilus assembly protein [Pirellulaceae bacterium]